MRVYGRVQLVMFRDSTQRRASKLGLVGYVKNLPDDSVEIITTGEDSKVSELFEWAKKGPLFARVDKFEIDKVLLKVKCSEFTILY